MSEEHKTGGHTDRPLSPTGDSVTDIPLVSVSTPRLINVHGVRDESGPQDPAQPAWNTLDESLVDDKFATGNHSLALVFLSLRICQTASKDMNCITCVIVCFMFHSN